MSLDSLGNLDLWRLLMSFSSGTLLALSGTIIQSISQNELAGSSTLGLDGLFVLIVLLMHFALRILGLEGQLEISSFMMVLLLISFLAGWSWLLLKKKLYVYGNQLQIPMNQILLLGLCFNLLVGAIFSVLQFLFITLNQQFPTQIWYGSFRYIAPSALFCVLTSLIFCLVSSNLLSSKLRLLSFGKDLALSFGIPVKKIIYQGLLLSCLAVGTVVCFFGVFSFLGLIFPHFLRSFACFRYNLRREILLGAPLCGLILALLDFLCFNFPIYGMEIPVGMLSAVLGSLGLVIILIRKRKMV